MDRAASDGFNDARGVAFVRALPRGHRSKEPEET